MGLTILPIRKIAAASHVRASMIFGALILLALGFAPRALSAGGTYAFSYSGRFTEPSGRPVTGPVALSISFYAAATGGTPALTITDGLATVPLKEGMFQVTLSLSGTDLQQAFPRAGDPIYVEVTDLSHRPNEPYERQLVSIVPYAAKIPVDDKTLTFDAGGRATLAISGTAGAGKLLSSDGSGGLAWIDPPSATVTSVGGVTAANVATGANAANAATNASTAGTLVKRDNNGGFGADNILVSPGAASRQGLIVKGAASQSANLQEWQDSNGSVLAALSPTGGFKLRDGDGTDNYVSLKAPTNVAGDVTYTLPAAPVAGSYLQTDASGNLSWNSPSGAGDMTKATYDGNNNGVVDKSEDGQKFVTGSGWAGSAPATLSTLSADLNPGDVTATVADTTGYPSQGTLLIGNEVVSYTGKTGTTFTGLTRGVFGTTDVLHSSGGTVNNLLLSAAGSSSTPKFVITGQGRTGIGTVTPVAMLETLSTSNIVAQIVRGAAGQTADLEQWQANDGTILAAVDKNGSIVMKGNSTNYATLKPSQSMSGDLTFTLPAGAGSSGDVLTTNGSGVLSWATPVSAASTATLTNKTIDASTNTISNLDDSTIKAGAAIARGKLATGTANHVLINDGTGAMSSEAQLAVSRGGTGAATLTSNGVLLGNGTSAVSATTAGGASTVLSVPSGGGAPTFATLVDANISSSAAIARSKLATGSNNHVLINDGSGNVSSEAQLALSRGGTGANLNATGGAGQFLKQTSAGGAVTVGTITASELPTMVASGGSHAPGLVPDPPNSSGTTKFLREDATWAVPATTVDWTAPGTIGSGTPNTGAFTTMTTTGAVGINKTSPGSQLVIKGAGATSATSSLNVTDSGDNSKFFVRDDGNVGIGTTAPAAKLEVHGSDLEVMTRISNASANGWSTLSFQNRFDGAEIFLNGDSEPGGAGPSAFNIVNGGNYPIALMTNSVERMRITGSGNVGIGTTSPSSTLEVGGAARNSSSVSNGTSTINFATGNLQYTTSSCGAFVLHNLKDGGSYTFSVKGATSGVCSFTAFSGAGTGSLTVHMPVDHAASTANKHTLYTFLVMGTDAYVAWVPGL